MSSSVAKKEQPCIRIGIPKVYPNYDPSELQTTPQVFVVYALGGTLVRVGDNNQYYSGIAESWIVSTDGTEITLKVSAEAKFSDGRPITTKDVSASLKRAVLYPGTHVNLQEKLAEGDKLRSIADEIAGIEVVDAHKIILRTKKREQNFLAWLSFPEIVIMPEKDAKKKKAELTFETTSGPYSVFSRSEKSIELRANQFFYEQHSDAAKCVVIEGFEKSDDAVAALRRKEIDLLDYGAVLDPDFQAFLEDSENYSFTSGFSNALAYFILNTKRNLFSSRENRFAFFTSVSGSETLLPYGAVSIFKPTNQFLPDTQAGFIPADRLREVLFEQKNSQINSLDGEKLTILYPTVFGNKYKNFLKVALEKQTSMLIDFKTYEEGEILEALSRNDYDAFFCVAGMGEKDTEILLDYHFNGKLPLYSFSDKVILKLLTEAKNTSEKRIKIGLYQKISEQLIRQAYVAPIAHFSWPIFHRSDLYYKRTNEFQLTNDLWRLSWR